MPDRDDLGGLGLVISPDTTRADIELALIMLAQTARHHGRTHASYAREHARIDYLLTAWEQMPA